MVDKKGKQITIFGSANSDFFFKVERAPLVGETISSKDINNFVGGKVIIFLTNIRYNKSK